MPYTVRYWLSLVIIICRANFGCFQTRVIHTNKAATLFAQTNLMIILIHIDIRFVAPSVSKLSTDVYVYLDMTTFVVPDKTHYYNL